MYYILKSITACIFYIIAILSLRYSLEEDLYPVMKIKIGVISDTHLNMVNEELERIKNKYLSDMDYILHAGDMVCTEVAEYLNDGNFFGVHGNMDSLAVKNLLPDKTVLEFGPFKIGLMHGWGAKVGLEERITQEFMDVDAIVYGHSHTPANYVKDEVLLFNPGTAIGYSSSGPHTFGILELGDKIKGRIIDI
jgi:uncharacterized protein